MSGDWAKELEEIAERVGDTVEEVAVSIKINLFSSIVDDTRVDTGRLKGNWSCQNKRFRPVVLETKDKEGDITKAKIERVANPHDITYLTNSLPYAVVYEEKDGMIATNVARIRQMVREEVEKARKK